MHFHGALLHFISMDAYVLLSLDHKQLMAVVFFFLKHYIMLAVFFLDLSEESVDGSLVLFWVVSNLIASCILYATELLYYSAHLCCNDSALWNCKLLICWPALYIQDDRLVDSAIDYCTLKTQPRMLQLTSILWRFYWGPL